MPKIESFLLDIFQEKGNRRYIQTLTGSKVDLFAGGIELLLLLCKVSKIRTVPNLKTLTRGCCADSLQAMEGLIIVGQGR